MAYQYAHDLVLIYTIFSSVVMSGLMKIGSCSRSSFLPQYASSADFATQQVFTQYFSGNIIDCVTLLWDNIQTGMTSASIRPSGS